MKIFHLATHTYNIGDGAVVVGAQNVIRQIFDDVVYEQQCLMEMENFWGTVAYDEKLIARMNSCDLVMLGGGGMIDRVRGRNHTGLAFDLPSNLWSQIKVPIFVFGVGENSFYGQRRSSLAPLLKFLMEMSSRVPVLFTVRNDGSLRRLVADCPKLGGLAHEIADPGLFWRSGPSAPEVKSRAMKVPKIGIQVAGDNPRKRSNGSSEISKVLSKFIANVDRYFEGEVEFRLIPHIVRDIDAIGKIVAKLPKNLSRLSLEVGPILRGSQSAEMFFSKYDECDLVLTMRGHGQICGLSTAAAIISLDTHPKIRGFAESIGDWHPIQPLTTRNIEDLLKASVNSLEQKSKVIEFQQGFVKRKWDETVGFLGEQLCEIA